MRLFVAINFDPALRAALFEATGPVRARATGLRWLPADNYHITLKFLGQAGAEQVDAVLEAMRAAARATSPFTLQIGELGAFPGLRRAHVVWLGIAAGTELATLQRALEQALVPLGFAVEERPYHPHVTIARLAARTKPVDLSGMERLLALGAYQQVNVTSIELMESKVSSKGARYEALATVGLEKVVR